MTPSDELFHLIKSLTPSEKRYFKIHASKHVIGKSNHYEKLFDALDVLPDDQPYDEAAFKKSLRGKSYGTHLSDEKSHLREMILRAMRVYHAERTPKGQLVEMMHEISFLYSKGFVKSCQQMIDKAMKLAEETEQYTEMLTLNDFLINLYRENPTSAPYTVAEIEHKEKDLLDRISVIRQAVYLRLKMTDIHIRSQWKEREAEAKIYFDTATRLSSRGNLSMPASVLLLNVRQRYLIQCHKYNDGLKITMEWLEKVESNGTVNGHLIDVFRLTLANYMMCAMYCERFELLPEGIAKLKKCRTDNEKEEANNFLLTAEFELIYLLNSGNAEKERTAILHEIEHGLKKYKRFIPTQDAVNFRFNISLLHFLHQKYHEALDHIAALDLLSGRDKLYDHTTSMARIMEWMCHSSIGNHAILDSNLRNLKRYFAERKIKHSLSDQMFAFFDAIVKAGNKRGAASAEVRKNIESVSPSPQYEQMKAIILSWI